MKKITIILLLVVSLITSIFGGASIGQQTGVEPSSGISSKGNASGVYEYRNKVMPTPIIQQKAQSTKTDAGEIVVTARKMEEDIAVVPRSVEVIKNDQIEDSGNEKLQDVLDLIAGMIVMRTGGYQGLSTVSMRGAPSAHTLVLLDGVPLNDMMTGGADLNLVDLNNIDRIEIVKGGLSSVYGGDAAAGVINIITKSKEEQLLNVSASYGSFNFQKYTASSDYKIFGVNYSISGVEEKSDGYLPNSAYLKNSINAKFSFTGDLLDSQVYGYYFNREMETPFGYNAAEESAKEWDENYDIGLDEKLTLGQVKVKVSGYMRSAQIRFLDTTRWNNIDLFYNHKKKEYNASIFTIYDEGGFISGMTGYETNTKLIDSSVIGKSENKNNASVTSVTLKLFDDKLLVNTGFRADFNSAFKNMTSENISVKYRFPENVDVRVSVDKSFLAPSMGQLYWNEDTGYDAWSGLWYFMMGNLKLRPESSETIEAGFSKKDENISESVVFFKSNIKDMITYTDIADGISNTTTYININKATITGVEAKADFKLADYLTVFLRYTYLNAVDGNNKQLAYRPAGEAGAGVGIKFPFNTKLTINGQYVDLRKDASGKTMKSYHLLNCSVVHKVSSNLKVNVDIDNVLDNTTYEIKEGCKMPGRNMSASINLTF